MFTLLMLGSQAANFRVPVIITQGKQKVGNIIFHRPEERLKSSFGWSDAAAQRRAEPNEIVLTVFLLLRAPAGVGKEDERCR